MRNTTILVIKIIQVFLAFSHIIQVLRKEGKLNKND